MNKENILTTLWTNFHDCEKFSSCECICCGYTTYYDSKCELPKKCLRCQLTDILNIL